MSKQIPDDYVAIATHICPICTEKHQHNTEVLIHKKLRSIKPNDGNDVVTGWGLCKEHSEKFDEGYIALVGIDEKQSTPMENGNYNPADVWRTGTIALVKREIFKELFNMEISDNLEFVFCDEQVLLRLEMEYEKAN